MWLFGGCSALGDHFNDTWVYLGGIIIYFILTEKQYIFILYLLIHTDLNKWEEIDMKESKIPKELKVSGHTAIFYNGHVYIFGGLNAQEETVKDKREREK